MAKRAERGKAYYMISAVSQKYNIHPQTLRLYEREGLLKPSRTDGNTRLYSEEDLEQLETILALTRDLGVNLAGVEIILNMRRKIEQMQGEVNEFMDYVKRELARGIDDWETRLSTALVKSSPTDLVRHTPHVERLLAAGRLGLVGLRALVRVPDEIGRSGLDESRAQALFPVVDAARELAFDVIHELVDLALHLLDLPPHVQDDLDAGEVHAEVARQREDRFELLQVLFGVEARVAVGARRLEQSFALVEAERLRVDVVLLRHRADHVVRLAAFRPFCHIAIPAGAPARGRR